MNEFKVGDLVINSFFPTTNPQLISIVVDLFQFKNTSANINRSGIFINPERDGPFSEIYFTKVSDILNEVFDE